MNNENQDLKKLFIYTDGASRGNPGPASYAFLFTNKNNEIIYKETGFIGKKTNNQAEYHAALKAIKEAKNNFSRELVLHSDSNLLVKQLNNKWNVKDPKLRELFDKIKEETEKIEITIKHVQRENKYIQIADRLCNQTLDEDVNLSFKGREPPPYSWRGWE